MHKKLETRPCAECGKPLTRLPSQFKRSKNCYCGPECKARHAPSPMIANRNRRLTRPCSVCGKSVTKYLSVSTPPERWTCSRSCGAKSRGRLLVAEGRWVRPQRPRTGKEVTCQICGKEFYQGPKQDRRFCSRACHNIGQTKEKIEKFCKGCGKVMHLAPSQQNRDYCNRVCYEASRVLRPTGRMHNGRPVIKNAQGYLTVYEPTHPNAAPHGGRILEHRLVMERVLGRYLTRSEQVDHINGDKTDNRPENLQVLSSKDHTIKTNADRFRREEANRLELEQYRRRFGPLDI